MSKNRSKKRAKQNQKRRQVRKATKEATLVTMPTETGPLPQIHTDAWLKAITARDQKVWSSIIDVLKHFEGVHYKTFGPEAVNTINDFVHLTYTAFMTPDFPINLQTAVIFAQIAHIFHHLVAVSAYKTNDGALLHSLLKPNNLPMLMFLQNARCETQIEQSQFFDANPPMASMWFQTYMLGLSSPTKTIQKNLYSHLANMDARWVPYCHAVSGLYFSCTYHAPDQARKVKAIMNKSIKAQLETIGLADINNNPRGGERPKIAIITNKWHRNHAVYKSAGPLVEQWLETCDLDLIWTNKAIPDTIVKDYFKEFGQCYFTANSELIIPDMLRNNDYDMVYFTDVGMTDESIWLSNCRIAPIQAVGYGHPDTTGDNNEIDYFFGGDIEKDAVEDAYAETCVLVPGLAQEPAWPTAERKNNYKDDGIVRINCVWGPDKYNRTLLECLAEINNVVDKMNRDRVTEGLQDKSIEWPEDGDIQKLIPKATHEFHLFGSPGLNRYAALPAFGLEIRKLLPNAIIHCEQEYYDYMENAEMHDFALNSYPFGCYNVLIESLYMGIPFLTLVGDRFYNRAGMWLNEQVDMRQNNFTVPREMVTAAAELIVNPETLKAQRDHLAGVDLKEKLFTLRGNHFREALEYTLANHPFTETKIIGDDK